jgi:hypothetical protein
MNPKDRRLNPLLKLVLDLGPLLLFFLANSRPALFLPLVSPILGRYRHRAGSRLRYRASAVAPYLPFAIPVGIGRRGWIARPSQIPWRTARLRRKADLAAAGVDPKQSLASIGKPSSLPDGVVMQ